MFSTRFAGAVLVVAGMVAGCSGGAPPAGAEASAPVSSTPTGASAPERAPAQVYVAVGASDTVGVGADDPVTEAWPQVLRDSALPDARLVNVGVSGATVSGALAAQVPGALAAEPDVATVWLAVNDLAAQVPVQVYERRLARLVHRLRAGGRTEVLVGNVPRLWRLPAYRACLAPSPGASDQPGQPDLGCLLPYVPTEALVRATVAGYNAAITRVARTEGARLVDLSAEDGLAGLVSADGFHPSTAGHRRLAAAFAAQLPGAIRS